MNCDLILDHDDVIKWKHFPRYWPFVRGIHRSPVNSPHKGQWRGALMFSLICAWINPWVNNRVAGDLGWHRAHYDVIVMIVMWHEYWFLSQGLVTKFHIWPDNISYWLFDEGFLYNATSNIDFYDIIWHDAFWFRAFSYKFLLVKICIWNWLVLTCAEKNAIKYDWNFDVFFQFKNTFWL